MLEAISLIIITFTIFIFAPLRKVFFPVPLPAKGVFTKKRQPYFDFIKGIAIISVIIIHVVHVFLYHSKTNDIFLLITINNLTRFAIPFFFVCSGILLTARYSSKINLKEFYYKKFINILLPYIILNIIIASLQGISITAFLYNIISGKGMLPYYFVIVLFQLYLLFPLVLNYKDSRIFLVVSFFVSLFSYLTPQVWQIYGILFVGKFFFFFAYGMYARNYFLSFDSAQDKNKKDIFYWYLIIFLYILIFFVFPGYYYNIRLFYGIAMFNLFFIYREKIISMDKKLYDLICSYGRNSLWIFLTHFPVVFTTYVYFRLFSFNYYILLILVFFFSVPASFLIGRLCCFIYNDVFGFLKIKIYER